jgi:hypothetical protein
MQNQDDGNVSQRFCIATLQKLSIREEIIAIYLKHNLLTWLSKLITRSSSNDIHVFCLEYGSALIANILHSNATLNHLDDNKEKTKIVCLS